MTPLLAGMAAWWLQCAILLGAGLVVPAVLGLRAPAIRLRLGQALLCAALLLPVLQPRRTAPTAGPAASAVALLAITAAEPSAQSPSIEAVVLAVLAAGALLRIAFLAAGLIRLRSIRRRALPFSEVPPGVAAAAARTKARADVLVSEDVCSPVTVGAVRPVVLVPTDFAALPAAEQEAIACHEFRHVVRRDGWAVLLEEFTRALLWYQPAAWAVLSRVRRDREQAVDRETVAATGDRRTYLRALARVAQRTAAAPASAIPFQTRSHAVERMTALVKEVPMSGRRATLLAATTTVLLAVIAGTASVAFPLTDAAKATSGDTIYKVGGPVSEPVELSRVRPVYPPEARAKGVTGVVKLNAVIDESGTVTSVEPVQSPDATLTAAAAEAVGQWTYKPAMKDGRPIKVRLSVTVSFMLDTTQSK
jgi:TonB family protein